MKESKLRGELVRTLGGVSNDGVARLNSVIVDTYGGLITTPLTRENIIECVQMGVRSKRWSGSMNNSDGKEFKGRVGIGYYSSVAYYNTYLLHESAHNLVENLGRPSSYFDNYYAMADEEEKMCWEFASVACKLMRLPYDSYIMDISSRYWKLSQAISSDLNQTNQEKLSDAFMHLARLEKSAYGFSMALGDEFDWKDEVPVLRN